jgi:hypothetical protein
MLKEIGMQCHMDCSNAKIQAQPVSWFVNAAGGATSYTKRTAMIANPWLGPMEIPWHAQGIYVDVE